MSQLPRYYDLSREELVALTDEQVKHYIELEIAYEGILPVDDPGPKPVSPDTNLEKTDVAFSVCGVTVRTREEAQLVADMDVLATEYDYRGAGYSYKWWKPVEDISITKVPAYRRQDVMAVREPLGDYERAKEAHSKENTQYSDFTKATSAIRDSVHGAVYDAQDFFRRVEQAKQSWEKYLSLAKGDEEVACNFFLNAHKGTDSEVIEQTLPDTVQQLFAAAGQDEEK